MRALCVLRQAALACAAVLVTLAIHPCPARCGQASPEAAAKPEAGAALCPRTLYLDTVTVRAFETSDNAQNMLHAACQQASATALAQWRAQALLSPNAQAKACAAQMGAQGCLTGQAYTQPRCTDVMCPLTQKCVVRLVRL